MISLRAVLVEMFKMLLQSNHMTPADVKESLLYVIVETMLKDLVSATEQVSGWPCLACRVSMYHAMDHHIVQLIFFLFIYIIDSCPTIMFVDHCYNYNVCILF